MTTAPRCWVRPCSTTPSCPGSAPCVAASAIRSVPPCTGGYAYGSVKTNIVTANSNETFSKTKSGWTVGAGMEAPFTLLGLLGPNWTAKTEYLYVDLGSTTDLFDGGNGVNTTKVTEHVFRTGINYHFNSPVIAKY
ncbi:MAG: outer membrane beta-barrel protein [Rhodopseudomonas palustris]|nr:outer membrane beta-barrel protein [Rhodopseudomonas palustris]